MVPTFKNQIAAILRENVNIPTERGYEVVVNDNCKIFDYRVELYRYGDMLGSYVVNECWFSRADLINWARRLIKNERIRSTPIILESLDYNVYSDSPINWHAELSGSVDDLSELNAVRRHLEHMDMRSPKGSPIPKITKVIFNDPATIVFWLDGTKTVVKCDDKERYDPEKGLAMAISKKALGNQGNYYNEFKRWLPDKMHVAPTLHVRPNSVLYDSIMSSSLAELTSLDTFGELEKRLNESIKRRFQNDL